MRYSIILFCLAGVIASCNTKKEEQTSVQPDVVKECYQYMANKDTVNIFLDFASNRVDGALFYKLYEKDKSEGTVIGEMKGDTLIVEYTFLSEGVTSTSEVVFLKRNNQLVQGFGETIRVEGKQIFKNRNTLDFNDSLVLTATECKD
jgi:hypothetical protein